MELHELDELDDFVIQELELVELIELDDELSEDELELLLELKLDSEELLDDDENDDWLDEDDKLLDELLSLKPMLPSPIAVILVQTCDTASSERKACFDGTRVETSMLDASHPSDSMSIIDPDTEAVLKNMFRPLSCGADVVNILQIYQILEFSSPIG